MIVPLLMMLAAAPAETTAKTADGDAVVCRHEKQTNSRFTKRVCRSKAQMEARALNDQEMLRSSQSAASRCTLGSTGGPGGC